MLLKPNLAGANVPSLSYVNVVKKTKDLMLIMYVFQRIYGTIHQTQIINPRVHFTDEQKQSFFRS